MATSAPGDPGKAVDGKASRFWRRPFDADTISVPRGEIHIIVNRCKGCGFCVEYCPTSVLKLSDQFNAKGYHPPEVVIPENCVECGLCETICPDFAMFVTLLSTGPDGKGGE